MVAIAGIVILAQFVLAAIVGVRLLRLPVRSMLAPERLLGAYFVVALFAGGLLVTGAYAGWQANGSLESPLWVVRLHAVGQVLLAIGYSCVLAFTWATFHRDRVWARALAAVGVLALAASYLGRVFVEGFAISIDPGLYHWLAYAARLLGLAWMGVASLVYWRRIRRRVSLGLADPMVVNRFALWALFALTQILTAMSEPMARLLYALSAGDAAASADGVQNVAGGVMHMALLFSSFWGSTGVAILFLTFFPTQAYQRWVLRHRG